MSILRVKSEARAMKRGTSRLTISLPTELLQQADERLRMSDEGRSAMLRRLIESALREIEEQEKIAQYVRAYREQPQTEEELGWSDQVTLEHFAELPW